MAHWRKMMDPRDHVYAEDLNGRDVDVLIERVTQGELLGEKGRKSKKPLAHFRGMSKPLALNKTNCKAIERIAGSSDTDAWCGVWITLYPATTQDPSGNEVPCVRVRPRAPRRGREAAPPPEVVQAETREPGQEG